MTFYNFTVRYASDLGPVFRSISFYATVGERIAVVGRTGVGKSSVALALLRVLDADQDGGWIEVDGVDIVDVELAELRVNAVTIIAQNPQFFSGNVCINLDSLCKHTDAENHNVL